MRKLFGQRSSVSDPEKEVKRHLTSVFKSQSHANKDEKAGFEANDVINRNDVNHESEFKGRDEENASNSVSLREKSWDSIGLANNSFSTVGSSATISTLKHFGLSNHPGKGADDVTIDAFMDMKSEMEDSCSKRSMKLVNHRPRDVDSEHSALLNAALSCIAKRDFNELLSIVKTTPEILLYRCKRNLPSKDDVSDDGQNLHGCYGGTLLHVLVSQKPSLKKKRRGVNSNSIKSRVTTALSCGSRNSYEIHVMPSVPVSALSYIVKKQPKAMLMKDDYGRLPIHCATLSLSAHLDEINKLCGRRKFSETGKGSYEVSKVIVREVNLIHFLLKFNPKVASVADLKGNLPIHYAVSIGPEYSGSDVVIFEKSSKFGQPSASETIKKLLEVNPQSIGVKNKEGNLPIHLICSRGPHMNLISLRKVIAYHSMSNTKLLTEKNNRGDPPLFLAIKSRAVVEAIEILSSTEKGSATSTRLFVQRDGNNNNPLHVALKMNPQVDLLTLQAILSLAPFTASTPDGRGKMPIKYATSQELPKEVIRHMLARDMPIEIGTDIDSKQPSTEKQSSGLARHVVGRTHHHSWWHILVECNDKYLDMVQSFLSEEATYAQIVTLARQVGPDGTSILINCVSDKCRLIFHSLLLFYGRYEILLSSKDSKMKPDEVVNGVQTFLALDHGLSKNLSSEEYLSKLNRNSSNASEISISTAVRVRSDHNNDSVVEVSLLSKEKSKVVLRCYQHEEAFFAEVKVREKFDFPRQYFEELYNYHRDETYTYLALSKAEKLCCITYERPDHTLADVFASVSSGGQRSQKWIEKCWIVLKQIATALKYLHNQGLIHGHLDSPNIAKYSNTWKIGKLGTVSKEGTTIRGTFRPCVPPESVVISSFRESFNTKTHRSQSNSSKSVSSIPRVKFSQSVEEVGNFKKKENESESRDDSVQSFTATDKEKREGNENSDFLSFLRFSKTSPPGPSKNESNHVLKETKELKALNEEKSCRAVFIPERCKATRQFDMWGFGLIMVQLLLGRCMILPNFEKAEDAILKKLHNYNQQVLAKICNQLNAVAGKDATDLVMWLLQKEPSRRPKSMEEVLAHKYFQVLTIYV